MKSANKITKTAMLLALSLVFQSLRLLPFIGELPYSTLIIGSLVNMCLYLSVLVMNEFTAGFIISICTPLVAFLQGHLAFVCLIPFVAVGNAVLVLCFYSLQKLNKYAAVAVASAAKWAVMFFSGKYLLHFFLHIDYDRLKILIAGFNLPQLITAVIGGIAALVIYKMLPKSMKNTQK